MVCHYGARLRLEHNVKSTSLVTVEKRYKTDANDVTISLEQICTDNLFSPVCLILNSF